MKYVLCFALLASLISCSPTADTQTTKTDRFQQAMDQLQTYFNIPGLAILVKSGDQIRYEHYQGFANIDTQTPVDSATLFPIASVSKIFAATIIFQLVEEGKLDLEKSVKTYLLQTPLNEAIKVKHLLAHTSQGTPGNGFLYSSRFSLLTQLVEHVSSQTYEQLLQDYIIDKLDLKSTYGLTNHAKVQALQPRLATPYFPPNEAGIYDPGLSTASGIVSTVRDLAQFDDALNEFSLLSQQRFQQMTSPYISNSGEKQPYGLGIFSQNFIEDSLYWGYGQNDCFSSLFLKVPNKDLTFILLANTNLLSDPARLIYGDVTYSLFAMAFLEHFVYDWPKKLDFFDGTKQQEWFNAFATFKRDDYIAFYHQKLRATALAASFMGGIDAEQYQLSRQLLNFSAFLKPPYPHHLSDLHALSILHEQGIDSLTYNIEEIAQAFIHKSPENPYPKVYLGFYYVKEEKTEQAVQVFQELINIPQTSPNWYTLEALAYLAKYYEQKDVAQAKIYYQRIVDIGWNYAGKLEEAKKKLTQL